VNTHILNKIKIMMSGGFGPGGFGSAHHHMNKPDPYGALGFITGWKFNKNNKLTLTHNLIDHELDKSFPVFNVIDIQNISSFEIIKVSNIVDDDDDKYVIKLYFSSISEYNQYQNSGLHTTLKCFNVELLSKFSKDLSDYICEEKNITFSITEPEVIIETKDEAVKDDTTVDYLTILESGIKQSKFSATQDYYRIEHIEEFEQKWMKTIMHTTFAQKSTSLKVELEYINKVINACNISQKFMDEHSIPATVNLPHGFLLKSDDPILKPKLHHNALILDKYKKKVNDKLTKFKILKKNVTDKLHKMKKKQIKSKITIKKKKKSVPLKEPVKLEIDSDEKETIVSNLLKETEVGEKELFSTYDKDKYPSDTAKIVTFG